MRNESKGGRPSKKTPDRVTNLLEAIARGLPYEAACALSGLSFRTFCDWRRQDPSFAQKVDHAGAQPIKRHLQLLEKAAPNHPKISMWFLERRDPEHWGSPEVQLKYRIALQSRSIAKAWGESIDDAWSQSRIAASPSAKHLALPELPLCEAEKLRGADRSLTELVELVRDLEL